MARAPLRTVRPKMLRTVYANPEKELTRLRERGVVVRVAPGTYTVKPDSVGRQEVWRPALEEAAIAYATTRYGERVPVLYGIGAARFHHAIPRAIGVTVIAVPSQHRPVHLADGGRVVFTKLDVDRLDARLEEGRLGRFLVTTPEQTLLDLLARPDLGDMPDQAREAICALEPQVDWERVTELVGDRPRRLQRATQELRAESGR